MYVCICNAITDTEILKAAKAGVRDLWGLERQLGVASGCGSCKEAACEILREARQQTRRFDPVVYRPSMA